MTDSLQQQPLDLLIEQTQLLKEINNNLIALHQSQTGISKQLEATNAEMEEISLDQQEVSLADVNLPLAALFFFLVKWAFASIPAALILGAIFGGFYLLIFAILMLFR